MTRSPIRFAALAAALLAAPGLLAATPSLAADAPAAPAAHADDDPPVAYITIAWGRSNWQATGNCRAAVGARTLEQNAIDLQQRGLFGVGGIVIDRTDETTRRCVNGIVTQSSWADLARLRDTYGWSFVSQGMSYIDMTTLSTDEERAAYSSGTLPLLEERGFTRAWGAFNFPNDKQDEASQTVVTRSFAFGREYGEGINTPESVSTFPYPVDTKSVNGGRCYNIKLPCSRPGSVGGGKTTPLPTLKAILNPAPGQWGVIQAYRLVEGKYGTMGKPYAWDCTSPMWQNRWTGAAEVYCRNTFLAALNQRSKTAVVADHATVAEAWGIVPSSR